MDGRARGQEVPGDVQLRQRRALGGGPPRVGAHLVVPLRLEPRDVRVLGAQLRALARALGHEVPTEIQQQIAIVNGVLT